MGHKNIQMTMNIYADVRKDDEQCIAYYSRGGPSSH